MTTNQKLELRGKLKKNLDPFQMLLRHWLKIIIIGTIVFLGAAPLASIFDKSYYETTGKIRISPVVSTFISQDESSITGYYHDYVRTQVDRIKSPAIIEKAVNMLDAELRSNFILEEVPISKSLQLLTQRLAVFPIRDTHIIQLYLKSAKPDGISELINNIINVYLNMLKEQEEGKDSQRLVYLQQEHDVLEKQIANQTRMLHEIAEEAGTSSFTEEFNAHTRQLQDLQEAYTRAYGNRVEKENFYKNTIKETEALEKISFDAIVEEMVEKDQALWDTSFYTYKTLQELRSSLDGMAKDNPDRKRVEERMEGMQKYLDKLREDVKKRAHNIVQKKRDSELKQKLIKSESGFIAAKDSEENIRDKRDAVQAKAAKISRLILKGQDLEKNLKNMQSIIGKIDERISELKL